MNKWTKVYKEDYHNKYPEDDVREKAKHHLVCHQGGQKNRFGLVKSSSSDKEYCVTVSVLCNCEGESKRSMKPGAGNNICSHARAYLLYLYKMK